MNYECDMPTDGLEDRHIAILMQRYIQAHGPSAESDLTQVVRWAQDVVIGWNLLGGVLDGTFEITRLTPGGQPVFGNRTKALLDTDAATDAGRPTECAA